MSRAYGREETMRIAAEKMRRKREREEREDREFYEKVTSGWRWNLFKIVMIFCTIVVLCTTIDTFFDGSTRKISKNDWHFDNELRMDWHKVVRANEYLFVPSFNDWSGLKEESMSITYSPILQTGKWLNYTIEEDDGSLRKHSEFRRRSIFNWFPFFQIFALIPLVTFIFKRQSSLFNFARITSLAFVFPGTLIALYFLLF